MLKIELKEKKKHGNKIARDNNFLRPKKQSGQEMIILYNIHVISL